MKSRTKLAGVGAALLFAVVTAPSRVEALALGDLVLAEPNTGLIRVNPLTGEQTLLISGGNLASGPTGFMSFPEDVLVDQHDVLYATVSSGIARFDPATGDLSQLVQLGSAFGFGWESSTAILVGGDIGPPDYDWGLHRVGVSGSKEILSAGQLFDVMQTALPAPGGGWFVGDFGAGILRVGTDGSQALLASLPGLWDIVLEEGTLYASAYEHIYAVDPITGAATVLETTGASLLRPGAMAASGDGGLYVTDLNAGAVHRIDLASGTETVVTSGGLLTYLGATGIAVVRAVPEPICAVQIGLGLAFLGRRRVSNRE